MLKNKLGEKNIKNILSQIEEIQASFLLELKNIEGKRDLKIKSLLEKKDKESLAKARKSI
ncbi:MAG: hypothetical protein ACOYL8_00675 [Patescibacteria group bacterium]